MLPIPCDCVVRVSLVGASAQWYLGTRGRGGSMVHVVLTWIAQTHWDCRVYAMGGSEAPHEGLSTFISSFRSDPMWGIGQHVDSTISGRSSRSHSQTRP